MATEFAVKVVRINDVLVHPNADKLELAQIAGWQCVIQKGSYKAGDLAIYIPIDSILPDAVERVLFGPDSKVRLHKSRVRTIKLRGAISQGMLASCEDLGVPAEEGYDCTKKLGIVKFEPAEAPPSMRGGNQVSKKKKNPFFKEYGGLDNYKYYPELFKDGEDVVVTEKIHGTNFRFGWVPTVANTPMKKLKKLFRVLPEYEFVFGSNKVQLQDRKGTKPSIWERLKARLAGKKAYQGFYEQSGVGNVYEEAVIKYKLKEITDFPNYRNFVFYGEIYGDGIQNKYAYGCKQGERKLILFDVADTVLTDNGSETVYLHHYVLENIASHLGLQVVPVLYRGPYKADYIKSLTYGPSVLESSQKIREGVVIRSKAEEKCHIGRKLLKLISDDYLLQKDNTDFH